MLGEVDAEMIARLESGVAELIRLATERRQHAHRLLDTHLTTVTDVISGSRCTGRTDAPRCVTMVRDLEPELSRHAHAPGVGELLGRLRAVG
ncbi:hypothetical protein [Streptomyces sp. NPDC014734]|uniref:hypothetical protein n=1 Tax=Streptomyces sp. NPDC014734 TaxID=3364886 RepID=UPI0036F9B4D8